MTPTAAGPPTPCSRSTTSTSPSTGTEILRGRHPRRAGRRAPRPDGPERLGEVDPRQHPARQPGLRGHRGPHPLPGRGHHRACRPSERAARGLFLGFQHPEEIPGVSVLNFLRQAMAGPQGHRRLLGARGAHGAHGVDEAPRHGRPLHRALPQRGLLRRREEAQRDPADGADGARLRGARRDRLRPRHRRAARRRRRHRRGAQATARSSASC